MTEHGSRALSTEIDISLPHEARVYDYWLGGKENYAADRALGDAIAQQIPTIRTMARANRAFLGRAVRYLVRQAGIRQFLDIGTGIPNDDNVHAVAQQEAPDVRVVYVDKDAVVLAHAHLLLKDAPAGSTTYIQADFRDPEDIVDRAGALIDLTQPVALMLVGL